MTTTQTGFVRHLRTLIAKQTGGAPTDQQLLERFLSQHSEDSFAALVERHGPMVLGVCRRVLHHTHDAEDVFQATFLVLARRASSIRKQESVGSFLHGVAYHLAGKLKAKAVRRARYERGAGTPPTADPAEEITWRELRTVLDAELQNLPEQYRSPLILCHLEGKTQDEAARQLGWSKSTFRRRLDRARDLLGRRLTRRGLTLSAALSAPLLAGTSVRAAVPPMLATITARAGLAFATGQGSTALVSTQAAALASAETKVKATILLLVMLDPDGKPFVGARLFLLSDATRKKAGAPIRATTDKDGRFHITARPADFGSRGKGTLAASAEGFGLDWIDVKPGDKAEEITLRLDQDDAPINGRVLDLEGRPIAGATVRVLAVTKRADDKDLTSFVERLEKYLKEGTPGFPNKYFQPGPLGLAWDEFQWKRCRTAGLDVPATVTTGPDGRFRLTGFGRERVLEAAIHGSTIAQTELRALTRTGPPKGWIRGHFGLYGCRLDYVATPCKPFVGTVRDKRTGKPLAGITVGVCQRMISETKTDSQGRYRIVGAAKGNEYEVDAGGMPYFNHAKHHIADTPGLEPITVDFELERGIIVRGRLIDKSTGKPVQGEVDYIVEPDNPRLKDFVDADKGTGVAVDLQGRTAADGSFTVLAIPGPGLLHVKADDVNRFVRAEDKGALQFHAEVRINPSENDPKSTTCEIALEPARVLAGSVVGPDGKPLAGVYAAGRWPIFSHSLLMHEKLESDSFLVGGMKAGRPRTLVFFHPEKKLGKVHKLQGDESRPLLVRLEPLDAALTGRILDAKGGPWPGLKVSVRTLLGGDVFRDTSYPPEFLWGYSAWLHLELGGTTTTDRDGRFRLAGLMPGLKYVLFAYEENAPQGTPFAYQAKDLIFVLESGKTKDLGDLKSKQTPGERTGK
jgi:RNA polymerase sigma factor (sigma-70 family)